MADWEQLREMTQHVVPPDFEALARTARRRQRRTAVAAGALACLVLAGGGVVLSIAADDEIRPAQAPPPSPSDAPVSALPHPDPGESAVDVDAGRYRVAISDSLAFEVDLPQGSTAHDDGLFLATRSFVLKTEVAGRRYGVPRDPCTDQVIEPAGPTVDDLVRALVSLPVYEVSRPRPVELGGAEGFYLEARIPSTYNAAPCERGAVQLPSRPSTAVSGPAPYLGRWWVLDVADHRVVVQQNCWGCTTDEFDSAPATPESITFTSAP
ncbi:hypothetical protein FHP29_07500 [Nocardioides albidus]|uniref:Uncharacterized protein n=1 Tax=Nocardioides albidus TaxID=1517589 RepID=A0A5C4W3V3_9ACTN|nr:hypothetical protein [Nocardioides albidus]TNM42838.1 hypothetical protein FHP29_07500 [Nocardioides albidus]